jgi:hypothetical protein
VGVAILLCFGGVALITQPSFLGFPNTGRITALGAFFALFQAGCNKTTDLIFINSSRPSIGADSAGQAVSSAERNPSQGLRILGMLCP